MKTKKSTELTLFDKLSRLTFTQAAKLLGENGKRLINAGGVFDIDIEEQVDLQADVFWLGLEGNTITIELNETHRSRLRWNCSGCDGACIHIGAAFALILEENWRLGWPNHRRNGRRSKAWAIKN